MAATTQNVYQVGFPEQLAPYAEDLVKTASAFTDITQNPYQQYLGERVAQYSPLQQQAQYTAAGMTPSQQLGVGSDIATIAGSNALNVGYGPAQFSTQSFNQPGVSQSYMSPYMQNVVDVQQQEAKRQAGIASNAMGAQAAQAGAYGGARQAIERGQANRNLQAQLANIQAQGLQSAYTQGQQQFNTEQAARAQAQQLGEQSRQFGANLGLQGQQTGLQAASILGNLGQQQATQLQDITKLQSTMGAEQQAQAQKILDTQYQDFLDYQNYPYKQMGFMSDILRGAPLTQTGSSVYQQAPSTSQSLLSAGLGAAGISKLLGKADGGMVGKGYAAGGITQAYAPGGSVMSPEFKRYAIETIAPQLLQAAQKNAMARGDMETANYATNEMAEDTALRRGISAALPEGADVVRAAGGGILAFADGGTKKLTAEDLVRQSLETGYTRPDEATRMGNIKTRRDALAGLYGDSEIDPLLQEDTARRQAAIEEMTKQNQATTLLRMASALQRSGVNDSDRYGGMYAAAAEGAEKGLAAKAAAENELYKAKLAGAAARQARKDGRTDKALEAENAQEAHEREAAKLKQEALSRGAQTIGELEKSRITAAAANRPTFEMQSVQAKLAEKLAADPTLKNDPKRLAQAQAQAYSEVARETRSAYTAGSRAELTAETALLKDDPGLDLLNTKLAALQMKKKPTEADVAEMAKLKDDIAARVAAIRSGGRGAGGGGGGGGGGAPAAAPMYATNGKQRIVSYDNGQTWKPVGAQ